MEYWGGRNLDAIGMKIFKGIMLAPETNFRITVGI